MSDEIQHFLIFFDHRSETLVEVRHFGCDSDAAVAAYDDAEEAYRDEPLMEIVLVGSDSLDTVKRTHANYFGGVPGEHLAGR